MATDFEHDSLANASVKRLLVEETRNQPCRPPPSPVDCPALIVGAGPVGLTLAAHLHRHGVRCRIVDQAPTASDKSKALVLWARSLEMLEDLGLTDTFGKAGQFLRAVALHGNARLLARITFSLPDTAYPQPLMLAQSETERLLTEHLLAVGIRIERPVTWTGAVQHDDHVDATLQHADGQEETVRCRWVLGCDGAHSAVRKAAKLEFIGSAEPNDWILADCHIDGIPTDELSLFWHSRGILAFFPFAKGRCRVIADQGLARGQEHPPAPTLAEVQASVDERGPGSIRLSDPVWLSGFRINERKVSTYQNGRLMVLGDAAHIHSPAGGQGMNTGMQDAFNLAWKLALIETGHGKPGMLLESYTRERGQVGDVVLRNATQLTWVITLRNPILQWLRNSFVSLVGRLAAFRKGFLRNMAELTINYPNSPLNSESTGQVWASNGIQPGDRFPDGSIFSADGGEERRLHCLLHDGCHQLLLLPSGSTSVSQEMLAEIARRAEATFPGLVRCHMILSHQDPASADGGVKSVWRDATGWVRRSLGATAPALALVRPDGYLGHRGQPPSWTDLRAHLERYLFPKSEANSGLPSF